MVILASVFIKPSLASKVAPGPELLSHMSYSLNSLKGAYIRDYIGDYYRGYEGGD